MTDLQILSAVLNNDGNIDYVALLNLNMTDPIRDPLADKSRVEKLIATGLLSGETNAYSTISITDKGRMHLQDAYYIDEQDKNLAKDAAKNKTKENKHDWSLAIGGAIIAGFVGLSFEVVAYFLLS